MEERLSNNLPPKRLLSSGRVIEFLTHSSGVALTAGLLIDLRGTGSQFSELDFFDLEQTTCSDRKAAAFGKRTFLYDDNRVAVFQKQGHALVPVLCGNGNIPAIQLIATNSAEVEFLISGAGQKKIQVIGSVSDDQVHQTWISPATTFEEQSWRGRNVFFSDAFNRYAVVVGRMPEGVEPEEARLELLGAGASAKLVVVNPDAEIPYAEFYNSNGRHGATPHTGLATMAMLAAQVPDFRNLFPVERKISFATAEGLRSCDLPLVQLRENGSVAIPFPTVSVTLTKYEQHMNASPAAGDLQLGFRNSWRLGESYFSRTTLLANPALVRSRTVLGGVAHAFLSDRIASPSTSSAIPEDNYLVVGEGNAKKEPATCVE